MRTIKIPANLSPEKESIEIAKQLLKNPLLLGNSTNILRIGKESLEIQELNTTIKIERVPKEPIMCICSCCDTNFEKQVGKKLYTNYGGTIKTLIYCSEKCRDTVTEFLPIGRFSTVKTKLKPSFLY